jgi:hypothetical protein
VASGQREKGGGPDWAAGRRGGDGLGQQKKKRRGKRARERGAQRRRVGFYFISKICFLLDFKTGFENNL